MPSGTFTSYFSGIPTASPSFAGSASGLSPSAGFASGSSPSSVGFFSGTAAAGAGASFETTGAGVAGAAAAGASLTTGAGVTGAAAGTESSGIIISPCSVQPFPLLPLPIYIPGTSENTHSHQPSATARANIYPPNASLD